MSESAAAEEAPSESYVMGEAVQVLDYKTWCRGIVMVAEQTRVKVKWVPEHSIGAQSIKWFPRDRVRKSPHGLLP